MKIGCISVVYGAIRDLFDGYYSGRQAGSNLTAGGSEICLMELAAGGVSSKWGRRREGRAAEPRVSEGAGTLDFTLMGKVYQV